MLSQRHIDPPEPENVPAVVHYYYGRHAAVTHPSGNDNHDNAIRTRQRLRKAGYRIVAYIAPAAETRAEAMRAAAGGG